LEQIGLQGRRVQMINLSSAMGGQFAFSIAELTAEIKQLGPNPLRNDEHRMQDEESLALRSDS
jgi:coenzyme F420-reducing hydrogenase delta subunit